jgi:hypothetical protein
MMHEGQSIEQWRIAEHIMFKKSYQVSIPEHLYDARQLVVLGTSWEEGETQEQLCSYTAH